MSIRSSYDISDEILSILCNELDIEETSDGYATAELVEDARQQIQWLLDEWLEEIRKDRDYAKD